MRNMSRFHFNKNKIFFIAEAGSNWRVGSRERDYERAFKLIDIASDAGADAIKFQTFNSTGVYVQNAGNSKYLQRSGIHKTINEIFRENSMPPDMLQSLASYCKKKCIEFMSTPFSFEDAKLVDKFVKIHKVASYEMNHIPLLEFLAKTKKPIIVSTGASTENEVDVIMNYLRKMRVKDIALLQCTACYPAPMRSMNLSVIKNFQKKYGVYVGLSDHSIEPFVSPLVAIGLGANIIEKHFTINRRLSGPDHKFALEPNELKNLIYLVRQAEEALGNGKKIIQNEESELRRFARRAIQAKKNIKSGDKLILGENYDILRPGNRKRGAEPTILDKIDGKIVNRGIGIGDGIRLSHIKKS